jgi:rhodanese-related sulfurtransferase
VSGTSEQAQIEVAPERAERWLLEDGAPQLVDVRERYEHAAGHIAGDRHIPLQELSGRAQTIDRDRPVLFYCRVGARSEMAAQAFRAAGYEAYTMSGGLLRWAREGRALEPADGSVADH